MTDRRKNLLTIFEFDKIVEEKAGTLEPTVPKRVFAWLETQALRRDEERNVGWLKLTQLHGQRAIQVTSYVGVIRAPCGFQIEVLPKTGRDTSSGEARKLLIAMLKCLAGFRHIKMANAELGTERMPLLEVFIQQFLMAVNSVVKRGLRSDYVARQDNLFALRGRLLMTRQISQNLVRRDRFFTEHDEFSMDRAENRLLHAALNKILLLTKSQAGQQLARELAFVFADAPPSTYIALDFQQVRMDRGMGYYAEALAWARLILNEESPIAGAAKHNSPSLLFRMEALFEAYVAKHLPKQLISPHKLKTQARSHYLVQHLNQSWFQMKPDLLVSNSERDLLVLDTKWKLLDDTKKRRGGKYQLSQADFYQLYAYGQHYLGGDGDIILVYPKTDAFSKALPVFDFPMHSKLRLWVIPFCIKSRKLILPDCPKLGSYIANHQI